MNTENHVSFLRYLTLKNVLTMKSNVGITHPANLCTVAEIIIQTQCYLFAADSLGLSYIRLYTISSGRSWMMLYVTVVQSHSRSLKLVPLGEARMQITIIVHCCDAHYAYLLSFPRYNDLLIRNLHLFFTAFTHRTFVWSNHKRVYPWDLCAMVNTAWE